MADSPKLANCKYENFVVNSSVNSKLTELMNYHGSDKGGKNNTEY